jgi:tetratricopeptide (TPR) repeat protein
MDLYQPCPGGLDKKIKFCCKDLVHELDDLLRKIDGDQLQAVYETSDRLLKKYPERSCLLAIRAAAALSLDEAEQARDAVEEFLRIAPQNPIALGCAAAIKAGTLSDTDNQAAGGQSIREIVDLLQSALAYSGDSIHAQVYDAIGAVARRLILEGHWLAGREHLVFQATLDREHAEDPIAQLLGIARSTSLSTLFKQELTLPESPAGVAWKTYFDATVGLAQRGLWAKAVERVESLAKRHPNEAVLWRSLAVLNCRLAEDAKATEALRHFADAPGVDQEEAVQAEALAQLLDPRSSHTLCDIVDLTYAIEDLDSLWQKIRAEPRVVSMDIDLSPLGRADAPPPRAVFCLLDRPIPAARDDLTADELPYVLCQLLLYGKETDRPARLVVTGPRHTMYPRAAAVLQEIDRDAVANPIEENVIREALQETAQTQFTTQMPKDLSPRKRIELLHAFKKNIVRKHWPDLPLDVLDGKTPREAAQQPDYRLRLSAAVLVLETSDYELSDASVYNDLRRQLGLEPRQPVRTQSVHEAQPFQLPYITPSGLRDDDLIAGYAMAVRNLVQPAVVSFGMEVVQRLSLDDRVPKAEILGELAQRAGSLDEALELAQQAQKAAIKQGHSPGPWKVVELGFRLLAGDVAEIRSLINSIQTQHLREPGVRELLLQQLARFGLVQPSPRGRPRQSVPEGTVPMTETFGSVPIEGSFTVGAGEANPPAGTEKKLWLPGME